MAKVAGPLLSLQAWGTIGGSLTVQRRPGRQAAYGKRGPKRGRTKRQHVRRKWWHFGGKAWAMLTEAQRSEYDARAAGRGMSGFNLFVREYCRALAWPDAEAWELVV
jgi:hypothetical protein